VIESLWVVGAFSDLAIYIYIYICLNGGNLECLGFGGFYGLIWLAVERLGMADIVLEW
jgi:hypothetical protein